MLSKSRIGPLSRHYDLFERSLTHNVNEILQSLSNRTKNKETYLVAELDSFLSFKIELKFTKTHLYVKGTLIFSNGKPVNIPEMHRDLLARKL